MLRAPRHQPMQRSGAFPRRPAPARALRAFLLTAALVIPVLIAGGQSPAGATTLPSATDNGLLVTTPLITPCYRPSATSS